MAVTVATVMAAFFLFLIAPCSSFQVTTHYSPLHHAKSLLDQRPLSLPNTCCTRCTGPSLRAGATAKGEMASPSWQEVARKVFDKDSRPVILYDGVCNLCNGGVNFMLDWDKPSEPRGNFRFAALQSEVGRALLRRGGRSPDDISSIVLACEDGNTYVKSEAILRIGKGLGQGTILWPLAPVASTTALKIVPSPVRDIFYDFIADNRYNFFGMSDECRLSDERFNNRFSRTKFSAIESAEAESRLDFDNMLPIQNATSYSRTCVYGQCRVTLPCRIARNRTVAAGFGISSRLFRGSGFTVSEVPGGTHEAFRVSSELAQSRCPAEPSRHIVRAPAAACCQ
eukprot:756687-Hanusia_phi.AAC.1